MGDKNSEPRHIKQGQIYYVDFPAGIGSVQAGIRPAIITSSNIRNRTSPTVIVAIVTSRLKKLHLDEHVMLPRIKGLRKKSMVAVEQRFTIDKSQLRDYCGRLKWEDYRRVHRAIRSIEGTSKRAYRF